MSGRSQARLTLTPFSSALTSPGKLRFPLYIDPQINDSSSQYYAEVANFGRVWNTTTGTTSVGSGVVEVGDCGYSDCAYSWNGTVYPTYVIRDYFRMNTSALEKRNGYTATVYSATFSPDEVGNSNDCTAQPVALYSAGSISGSTTWGGPQGSELTAASSAAGGGSGCPAAHVELDATSYLQSAANAGWPNTTFELRAPDESDEYEYKLFTDNPTLTVWYNFAPLTPTVKGVSKEVACTSTVYTSDATPVISAAGKDNNPSPLNLDYTYALDTENTTLVKEATLTNGGGGYASGSTAGWTAPSLTSGEQYKVDVRTSNVLPPGDKASSRTSPWSGNWHFTVLSAPPSAAPTIQSFDFPSGQWGQAEGAPGAFTVGTNGDSNIAGFAYSFDGGSGSEPVPDTSNCGYLNDGGLGTSLDSGGQPSASGELSLVQGSTAQIMVPPSLAPGRHTLYVRAFDYAHNASPEAAYAFYVAPDYQTASQPVTRVSAASLLNSVSASGGATVSQVVEQPDSCCSITTWPNEQLLFNATAAGQSFTVPLNVPDAGTWQLGAYMTQAPGYGDVRVELDAGTATEASLAGTANSPFDGYAPRVSDTYLDLGTPTLAKGTHTLTFTVAGAGAKAGYQAGLVYLTLSPTNRYEADSLASANTGGLGTLLQQCFAEHLWADYCQLMLADSAEGATFTVTFDAPVASDYALGVRLTTAGNYGEDTFTLDPSTSDITLDDTVNKPIDTYSSTVSAKYVFLGGVHLSAGDHVLQVTVAGKDASSTGYDAGIDFLEAAPVTGASDASFTAAMNNQGITSDGSTLASGNFDLTSTADGNNLSLQAMTDAGITPGTGSAAGASFSMDGAALTMPRSRTGGSGTVIADNVIPDGQTIPLPTVNANAVALLMTSTCGASPAAAVTLAYGGTSVQPSQAAIPLVPDWVAGTPAAAAVRFGWLDQGDSKVTTERPKLYEVMLPANPNAPLASVTLPVMPVNFLPDSGSCTTSAGIAHILAIGVRPASASAGAAGVWTGAYDGPMDVAAANGPALNGQTLRESVPLSADGSGSVRLRLSNAFSPAPVTFSAVTVAAQSSGAGAGTVTTPAAVTFGGSPDSDSVTIPAGGDAYSNAVALPSMSGGSGLLTVSIYVASSPAVTSAPIHESVQRLSTYYAAGNDTTSTGSGFTAADSLEGVYYLSGVDVSDTTATDGTIAVLGDQGATAAPAWHYDTWVMDLPSALSSDGVTVPGSIVNASTSDAPPAGWWRMNGTGLDTSSTAYDSGTDPTRSLTLEAGPSWSPDNPGTGVSAGSLSLNGTSQYAQASGPAITGTGSFAVSAWVKLSSVPSGAATAVSQSGSTDSSFNLGVSGGKWAFWLNDTDTASPAQTTATGPAAAVAGAWTMLTGVYNQSLGQIQLYVNGTLVGSASDTPSWSAAGNFTVGRSLLNGTGGRYWPGNISDVRAYNRLLWNYNVSEIYHDTGVSSVTAAFGTSAFQRAAAEPGLRDVIVSLGANDILQGASAKSVETSLTNIDAELKGIYASDGADAVLNVIVTTVHPLGLSSSDPREAVREAVNAWLVSDGTSTGLADQVADIASAVESSSSPNLISSSYLSGGVPDAAYYTP